MDVLIVNKAPVEDASFEVIVAGVMLSRLDHIVEGLPLGRVIFIANQGLPILQTGC